MFVFICFLIVLFELELAREREFIAPEFVTDDLVNNVFVSVTTGKFDLMFITCDLDEVVVVVTVEEDVVDDNDDNDKLFDFVETAIDSTDGTYGVNGVSIYEYMTNN